MNVYGPASEKSRFMLPSSISRNALIGFAGLLLIAQLLTGTDPVFAGLIFLFVLLSGAAFNLTGGLSTAVGVAMTMMSFKIVILSQVAKVLFGQPANSYLEEPIVTAAVLVVGLASMVGGLWLAGNWRNNREWLQPVTDARSLFAGTIATLAVGSLCSLLVLRTGVDAGAGEVRTGGGLGVLRLLTVCTPMATIFATAYTIVRTNHRRSFSGLVAICMFVAIAFAIAGGTKMGFFEPILNYALTSLAWRFRFRRTHAIVLAIVGVLSLAVVWPLMQTLKSAALVRTTFSERVELLEETLSNITSVSDLQETRHEIEEMLGNGKYQYYGRPVGWLERFSLIEQDDELVIATLQSGESGSETLTHGFRALVPSFIDPDKPTVNTGSYLARRCGMLADDDDETQIAFGIIAESFSAYTWLGVLLIPGLLMIAFVNTTGRISGGIYSNVWTVYLCSKLQHTFVEATVSALIQEMMLGTGALFAIYALVAFARQAADRLSGSSAR
jgi:hypothetical protein